MLSHLQSEQKNSIHEVRNIVWKFKIVYEHISFDLKKRR